ncbi:MAG TPA: UDP-N-acetylmuramoyl-L-alanine--D-glutamate ligase [Thermoanaerobaculia bacterium]|nr:UDP-N-acetylmuramoyl-L-alanine--D-glutamate ligase [Thermoanaerobaculia bacterium]
MRAPWAAGADWRRVLVYGLGLSGKAAARLLLRQGVAVVGVDSRPAPVLDLGDLANDPRLELLGPPEPSELPPGIDGVVLSPGVPPDRPLLADARRRGVPVIAEVELAFPFLEGPVVAITGSNGKSTTTALAGAMLRAAGRTVEVCGNIGEPLAGRVEGPPGRVFVVELSSFQIEGIVTFRPQAAALLNLSEDHLDRYAGMAEYAAAKKRLFTGLGSDAVAVLNADDPATLELATAARKRLFSRRAPVADGCYLAGGQVVEVDPGEPPVELFAAADVPLAGVQNLENAMAAALLARGVGADPAGLRAGLRAFRGLPHRLERVGERAGVVFYDDSKGTNPAATAKSLEGFADGSVHLILGGRNKGADLGALAPVVGQKAKRLYLIGEAAEDFARALAGAAPAERTGTLERAVAAAAAAARPGEAVILSPACASFDQFRNFVHRGEVFQALVRGVVTGGGHGQEAGV